MPLLTRDSILAANDLPRIEVAVPEWGGSVFVRTLTSGERDSFEASVVSSKKKMNSRNIRARLAAISIVDASGVMLFSDDDVEALGKKSAKAMDRIFEVAQDLNGVTKDDVQELEKNSGAGLAAG